jgi:Fic family protein
MSKTANNPGKRNSLGAKSVFVPAPLPPPLEWTLHLIGVHSDADRLIGRLAGEGGRLPNPHVCRRLFLRREAVLSCRIEGTQATLGELLAADAGAVVGEVDRCLADLQRFLHDSELPPLVTIALAHYQLEAIHPFFDGNGRMGRLLITLFLIERKILPTPLLYLSAFFEATLRGYYDGMRGVSEQDAWLDWLEYFLQGVARMFEDALSRATRINSLLTEWHSNLAGQSTSTTLRVIDLLAANPFLTITGTASQLKLAFTTAQRAIERLEQKCVVRRVSDAKRDRVYCAQALLDILEEPPHLVPSVIA